MCPVALAIAAAFPVSADASFISLSAPKWSAAAFALTGSDSDGDGVPNYKDDCPNTPSGEDANSDGCGCSQINCNDNDPCTIDTCNRGECCHTELECGDGDACTWDQCDPNAPGLPKGNIYTIGGATFGQGDTPTVLSLNSTSTNGTTWTNGWAAAAKPNDNSGVGETNGNTTWLPGFDVGKSTYRLVPGYSLLLGAPDVRSKYLSLGVASGGDLNSSASLFTVIQLQWNAAGTETRTGGPGSGVVVHEAAGKADPEAYAVRVRNTSGTWSDWRYEKPDGFTDVLNTSRDYLTTVFELSNFGAGFNVINAVQVVNLLPASRVSGSDGQGKVSLSGSGYSNKPKQGSSEFGDGGTFGTSEFDADIVYVGFIGCVSPECYCISGPKNCDDGDACTIDTCVDGNCCHTPKDCADGDKCTVDSCAGGNCVHTAKDCGDGDNCTVDTA